MNLIMIALSILFIIVCSAGTVLGYYLGTGKWLWESDDRKGDKD